MSDPPQSWRVRFEEAAKAYGAGPGPRALCEESLDAYVESFPITEYHDELSREAMDDLHRAALRSWALYRMSFLSSELEHARLQCESPIEVAMLYALAIVAMERADSVVFRARWALGGEAEPLTEVEIEPQARIGEHRVDFLLTYRSARSFQPESSPDAPSLRKRPSLQQAQLIVECDGHDWHDRTKEQASSDRARDRSLQSFGMPVHRFTGSDIWSHPFRCAVEAVEALQKRVRADA